MMGRLQLSHEFVKLYKGKDLKQKVCQDQMQSYWKLVHCKDLHSHTACLQLNLKMHTVFFLCRYILLMSLGVTLLILISRAYFALPTFNINANKISAPFLAQKISMKNVRGQKGPNWLCTILATSMTLSSI